SRYGLIPLVGLIVGFDHDDETVFDELYGFIDRANAPTVGISLLNAPPNTPLYERLQKEGRLEQEDFSGEWQLYSNIIPKNMSKEILVKRYRELFKKLYEPEAFQKRFEQWMRSVEYFSENYAKPKITVKQLILAARMFGYYIFRANRNVRKLFFRSLKLAKDLNPQLINHVFAIIAQYAHYYEFTQNLEKKKSN
ncbi:MAG: DUF4070 domain-containing protein, partial [bacterium]|nr:DUF4070 domain-containing protein [bacterium]